MLPRCTYSPGVYTVELVYRDHIRDQLNVVSEGRWSLYRGAFTVVLVTWCMADSGHLGQVVCV